MRQDLRKQGAACRTAGRAGVSTGPAAGFTFVELLVYIIVVPIALVGIMVAVQQGTSRAPQAVDPLRRNELIHLYLEEIISSRYDDRASIVGADKVCTRDLAIVGLNSNPCSSCLGPDGEGRIDFNDVDDFHGLQEGRCFGSSLLDARGIPRNGYNGFCVQVEVAYDGDFDGAMNEGLDIGESSDPGCTEGALLVPPMSNTDPRRTELTAKRILLTITDPNGEVSSVATYRGGF